MYSKPYNIIYTQLKCDHNRKKNYIRLVFIFFPVRIETNLLGSSGLSFCREIEMSFSRQRQIRPLPLLPGSHYFTTVNTWKPCFIHAQFIKKSLILIIIFKKTFNYPVRFNYPTHLIPT